MPLSDIVVISFFFIIVWGILGRLLSVRFNSVWRIINIVTLVISLCAICFCTLYSRGGEYHGGFIMNPFYGFITAKDNIEMYRTMLMNVFLFVPLGVSLPNILKSKHKYIIVLSLTFIFSLSIELIQYCTHIGIGESMDIMCNTFGCAVGCISSVISEYKRKKYN